MWVARGCGDAGPVGVTASGCQRTHTVQQRSRTTLQAERHFTSGVSLQELNPTFYSFWHCGGQEEPSSSPGQSGFGIFPHYLPRGQPEDLPVAVLFIPAGWCTKEFPLNSARSTGNLCLSSEVQWTAGYQTLGALPPNTMSCPAQTQNDSNAPDLWFLPVVFFFVCDFCRYEDFNKGLEGAPWFKWEWVGNTMFPSVLNTCFLVACDSWVTDTIVHLSTPAPIFHCNHTSFLVSNSKCVVCLFFF